MTPSAISLMAPALKTGIVGVLLAQGVKRVELLRR